MSERSTHEAAGSESMRPRLLLISAGSDYGAAVAKGNVSLLEDFDEGGFFTEVVVAFPFAPTSRTVRLSDRVTVVDIGWDWIPLRRPSRGLRWLLAPVHLVRTVCSLLWRVLRNSLDIVRATDPMFAGPIGWIVARLSGRPLCVSIHADFDKRHALGGSTAGADVLGSRALARRIERFVLSRAEMVMPIRDSLRGYALSAGASEERIRVIPHGTDLGAFVSASPDGAHAAFGVEDGRAIISFAGRLVRENYVDDVLEAAWRLASTRDDFAVVIVGGGPEEDRLKERVAGDPVLRRVVTLHGFAPRERVAQLRRASAISLCLMGGYSLIEACAAGSAVVAYDVEWHRELIHDGETGFLVGEHDLGALTDVLAALLDAPPLRERVGAAAQQLALSRHSLEESTAIKRRTYLELLRAAAR